MIDVKHSLSLKPIAGYTCLYLHNYKTPWGEEVSEIKHGRIENSMDDLPGYYEYDRTDHKYLGIGMVTIVPVQDSSKNPVNTSDHLFGEDVSEPPVSNT